MTPFQSRRPRRRGGGGSRSRVPPVIIAIALSVFVVLYLYIGTVVTLHRNLRAEKESSSSPERRAASTTTVALITTTNGAPSKEVDVPSSIRSGTTTAVAVAVADAPPPQEEPKTDDERCAAAVARLHRLKACYDRRIDPASLSAICGEGGRPPAAPVYHWAAHQGSGFGRPVTTSVGVCALALALGRPCVVDHEPRDEHYTWRSFVNGGRYDWDAGRASLAEEDRQDVVDALEKMPRGIGSSWWEWGRDGNRTDPGYPHVIAPNKVKNWDEALSLWGAQNASSRDKILLSPNYGNSWFPHVKFPKEATDGCPHERLITAIQNEMYEPTALTWNLHGERRAAVLNGTGAWNPLKRVATDEGIIPAPPQHRYGAIHIRTKISDWRKRRLSDAEYVDIIRNCISSRSDIPAWWIVADREDLAEHISSELTSVSTGLRVFSSYPPDYRKDNSHSYRARGVFEHPTMAPSILDWMVLYDAEVAAITAGSFGDSGARGKGKMPTGPCGELLMRKREGEEEVSKLPRLKLFQR